MQMPAHITISVVETVASIHDAVAQEWLNHYSVRSIFLKKYYWSCENIDAIQHPIQISAFSMNITGV
jgi:hypothetical protein